MCSFVATAALVLSAGPLWSQANQHLSDLRHAAEQRDVDAQVKLGITYEEGRGVPKDEAEAVRWFRLAAEQGDPTAQFQLGVMYTVGRGVLRRNLIVAHMWLNIASANGSDAARKARDIVRKRITKKQIEQATAMARACMASDYAGCSL